MNLNKKVSFKQLFTDTEKFEEGGDIEKKSELKVLMDQLETILNTKLEYQIKSDTFVQGEYSVRINTWSLQRWGGNRGITIGNYLTKGQALEVARNNKDNKEIENLIDPNTITYKVEKDYMGASLDKVDLKHIIKNLQ